MRIFLRIAVFALLSLANAWAGQLAVCEPSAEVRAALEKAAALSVADPTASDQNIAPFQALRERYPGELFVHERYQDAVQQYGIEGHLRELTENYQALALEHSGVIYRYLFARSTIGRSTVSAIQQMNDIVAEHPEFAPAHRALAEIYGSETFHNAGKEKIEWEQFSSLCPGTALARRPAPLPEPSPLIERAEKLLLQDGADPSRAAAMAIEGLRADEWRLQRIRPFDWYSVEYKRQNQRHLQTEYWRVWGLQVRCYRKAHQMEKAAELLRTIEQRAARLRSSDPSYSDALDILARLHAEGGEKAQARP